MASLKEITCCLIRWVFSGVFQGSGVEWVGDYISFNFREYSSMNLRNTSGTFFQALPFAAGYSSNPFLCYGSTVSAQRYSFQRYLYKQQHTMRKVIILLCLVILGTATDWTETMNVIQQGIDQGLYPGGVIGVANSKGVLYTKAFGHMYYKTGMHAPPVTVDAKFDLGHLSQMFTVIGTLMRLYDNGTIQTSDRVSRYMTAFVLNNKTTVTFENLLLHNSGLEEAPAVTPTKAADMTAHIMNQKLAYTTGTKSVYSDEGMILAGLAVQKILNRNMTYEMFMLMTELGLRNVSFTPTAAQKVFIPPTIFRKKYLQGSVMSALSELYNGTAGNAGLFAPVNDVMRFMRLMLNRGQITGERRYYDDSAVDHFTSRVSGQKYNNSRALGFDTVPIDPDRPCGNKFGVNSFGVFGETGTMAWADKDKDVILVILTNSANGSGKQRCKAHFGKISDAVMTALGH